MSDGFELWKRGIDKAATDPKWDQWDCLIIQTLAEYRMHITSISRQCHLVVDWWLIKAILWVETGAENPAWKMRPMQIGNLGDAGMDDLLSERGRVIVPPTMWHSFSRGAIRTNPTINIRAGIGYLILRASHFNWQSVPDADTKVYEVAVKPGDTLDKIAHSNHTTQEVLRQMNTNIAILNIGQKLRYRKAKMRQMVTKIDLITLSFIASKYNGGGDPLYLKKLEYVFPIIKGKVNVSC